MNQSKQSTHRPRTRPYAVPLLLLLLLACGASPEAARGQWTTNGNNISNTNTGNVGIGTTAPTAKLDVNGSASISGSTTVAGQGTFFLDGSNVLNFSVWSNSILKLNAASLIYNGTFETFDNYFGMRYTGRNALTVRIPAIGSAYFNQGNVGIGTADPLNQLHVHHGSGPASMRVSGAGSGTLNFVDSSAALNSKLFQWRSEGGLFRMALVNDAENAYVQQNLLVANAAGNVGIGMTPSNYKLDVSGEINATGLRINGTPVGTGGGSSPWATGSGNVYYSTGNVGVGTATPAYKLDVRIPGQVNDGFHLAGSDSRFLLLRPSSSAGAHNNLVQSGDTALIYGGNGVGTGSFVIAPWANGTPSGIKMDNSGNVGIGTPTPSAKLDVNGNINVSGNINAKYQDVAEWVESSQQLEAGTVVALDPEKSNQVLASSEAYDTKVAGVVSARPGLSLGERGEGKVLVATMGRVRVKVDATRAPIKIGDLLVTSDVAGVAMKSEPISINGRKMHAPGTLIGKALESLSNGTGEILVLLSLQ